MEVKEEVMTIESPEIKEHETIEIPIVKDVEGAIKTTGDKSVMKQDDDKDNEIDHAVTIEEIDEESKEAVKDDVQAVHIDESMDEDMKVEQIESVEKIEIQEVQKPETFEVKQTGELNESVKEDAKEDRIQH